jgi:hypothetical protein
MGTADRVARERRTQRTPSDQSHCIATEGETMSEVKPGGYQLIITVNPGEPTIVTGPLQETGLCYMALELARDVVTDHKPKPKAVLPIRAGLFDPKRRN